MWQKITLLSLLISFAVYLDSNSGGEIMKCQGDVTNAYSSYKMEYQTFAKKNVSFSLSCGWIDQYLKGGKDCISHINGTPVSGYMAANKTWHMFGVQGDYNLRTQYLNYKLTQGYMETGNVESLNQTQKWFRGYCK
jgi:hypothetical protein